MKMKMGRRRTTKGEADGHGGNGRRRFGTHARRRVCGWGLSRTRRTRRGLTTGPRLSFAARGRSSIFRSAITPPPARLRTPLLRRRVRLFNR
ncbi:ethylene-responsive transcription factor erf109 [Phtheirospermum japonicum]|uniref:Ethylene-responsive transcription factor erf109 n=1 Tax=Phtheirospermum japonicum TaxID=374723 RepID=A0A830CIZ3_9LAMI|nr:ethylene-responsive transcription factor erf109 [Phtheirospermum japonicum]